MVMESTPNGAYGCFYEEWGRAVGVSERTLAEHDMTLQRQIRRIDLEVKAVADNGLVLDT